MHCPPMKWMFSLKQNVAVVVALFIAAVFFTGCQTNSANSFDSAHVQELLHAQAGVTNAVNPNAFTIREGDMVRVTFPGAPNLNAVQLVRRDGKIELPLLGELQASGLTTKQLEDQILKQYGNQLLSKEVTVTVDSATYDVYVTGAVIRPGKVAAIRPITALEAIMESGGFDYTKANLKTVRVIRQENGKSKNYQINLRDVLEGKHTDAFYLKPSDIIYVPEKFNWF
jgi:polysaccharide biosynthesis/export protein